MRIAIFSDLHLGFNSAVRGTESIDMARSAFNLALENDAELILLAGDLFDTSVPSQETLLSAFGLFSEFGAKMRGKNSGISITRISRNGNETETLALPAIIAIHGTHEFRGKDYANVLQLFERAGFLIYLHAQKLLVRRHENGDGETICIQGMGGVPEKKSLDVLNALSPKPERGAKNIFMLHQSIKDFLPFDDEMVATISLSQLPQGFDLIVNGHLHWHSTEKLPQGGVLLMPGSTITTQMKKLESEKEKGIFLYDTERTEKQPLFIPLPVQRKFFYHKLDFKDARAEHVSEKAAALIADDLKQMNGTPITPLIRVKMCGTLAPGINPGDVNLAEIENEFGGRAILSLSRDFSTAGFKKKMSELREMQQSKKSVVAMGLDILEKNLEETDFNNAFDTRRIFELLAEGETERAMEILSGNEHGEEKQDSS
ncbi:MAG: metallophosphoesterase [Candidatus Diapherotrites archaeon]|nr:metallophosphoesterase [Candidatus Micrarchaeota archaeon]MBU1939939.1 metallophosphoesterase [Candidatus Micrarchaeota archaeon]